VTVRSLPPIYAITDRRASGVSAAENVRIFAEAGIRCVQIREKDLPGGELLAEASAAAVFARRAGAQLLVDDRPDVARIVACGVHLGEDDLPAAAARALLGPDALIGVSTHDLDGARLLLVQGGEKHEIQVRAQAHRLVRYMAERNAASGGAPALCSHDELMHAVWEDEPMHTREELAKLVWELRKRLEPYAAADLIENERGRGYRLRTCPPAAQRTATVPSPIMSACFSIRCSCSITRSGNADKSAGRTILPSTHHQENRVGIVWTIQSSDVRGSPSRFRPEGIAAAGIQCDVLHDVKASVLERP